METDHLRTVLTLAAEQTTRISPARQRARFAHGAGEQVRRDLDVGARIVAGVPAAADLQDYLRDNGWAWEANLRYWPETDPKRAAATLRAAAGRAERDAARQVLAQVATHLEQVVSGDGSPLGERVWTIIMEVARQRYSWPAARWLLQWIKMETPELDRLERWAETDPQRVVGTLQGATRWPLMSLETTLQGAAISERVMGFTSDLAAAVGWSPVSQPEAVVAEACQRIADLRGEVDRLRRLLSARDGAPAVEIGA